MSELHIGLQLYSIRPLTRTREDSIETLKRVAAMGYRAVQVQPDCIALPLEECGAIARDLGLAVCASHVSTRWILEHTDEVIEAHKKIGCDIIGIGEMPERYWGSAEGFTTFARDFSPAARRIKESGLKLIYHNHQFEFLKFDGALGMDILLREFDPAAYFELDTYWAQTGGADPSMWIRKLSGRIPIVHFKDMALNAKWEQVYAPVGEGNLNWPGILDACRDAGVTWCVVEQDDCFGKEFECVESSLRYLQKLGLK